MPVACSRRRRHVLRNWTLVDVSKLQHTHTLADSVRMQSRCARQGTSAVIFKSTVRHQCTSVRNFGPSSLHKPFGLLVSIRGGRESASNAACSRQLVFSKSRRTPPPCAYPPAPIHGERPKARSVGSMSVSRHHWTQTTTTKRQGRHDSMERRCHLW